MGGIVPVYVRPTQPTGGRICTFWTHVHRTIPSKEPGVDYYCPIGTPLVSIGNGKVLAVGGGIAPATGRSIWVGLDDGRSFRYLHLTRATKNVGDRVRQGEVIAISGASGYGSEFFGAPSLATIPSNTGGPHVHATLFPAWSMNFAATLDLELYTFKTATAGGIAAPFPEEDDMTPEQSAQFAQMVADVAHLKAVSDNTVRAGYGHILDEGDLGTLLSKIGALQGAPHPTRNDYGRVMDAGDLQQILNAISALARPIAPEAADRIDEIIAAIKLVPAKTADEIDDRARERLNG